MGVAALLASAVVCLIPVATPTLEAAVGAAPLTAAPGSADRSRRLTGAPNARYFAGYRGTGGAQVDSTVIRSNNLSRVTHGDIARLTARSVRSVVDLRTGLGLSVRA